MDPFLRAAIEQAQKSLHEGGIPIGSVLVHNNEIVGAGHNRRVQKQSVVLHAEMDALENAGRRTAAFYRNSILYTTLAPCSMCTGAVLLYNIPKVVIGENITFPGNREYLQSGNVQIELVQDETCIEMMKEFISRNPSLWNEDISE